MEMSQKKICLDLCGDKLNLYQFQSLNIFRGHPVNGSLVLEIWDGDEV